MHYLEMSGYGYSKLLCEDVTTWFLNRFLPRHKIEVEILHRGLKREQVYGYCDYVGESYRPREFLIELQTHMDEELYIKTLLHELVHLRQWVIGSLASLPALLTLNVLGLDVNVSIGDVPSNVVAAVFFEPL